MSKLKSREINPSLEMMHAHYKAIYLARNPLFSAPCQPRTRCASPPPKGASRQLTPYTAAISRDCAARSTSSPSKSNNISSCSFSFVNLRYSAGDHPVARKGGASTPPDSTSSLPPSKFPIFPQNNVPSHAS